MGSRRGTLPNDPALRVGATLERGLHRCCHLQQVANGRWGRRRPSQPDVGALNGRAVGIHHPDPQRNTLGENDLEWLVAVVEHDREGFGSKSRSLRRQHGRPCGSTLDLESAFAISPGLGASDKVPMAQQDPRPSDGRTNFIDDHTSHR